MPPPEVTVTAVVPTLVCGVAHKTAGQIDTGAPGTTSTTVLSFGRHYQASGCVVARTSIVNGLLEYPAAYYVSVHGGV